MRHNYEDIIYWTSTHKITTGLMTVGIISSLFTLFFVSLPAWKASGPNQLMWLVGTFLWMTLIAFFFEQGGEYDPETSERKNWRYAALLVFMLGIVLVGYLGYQSLSFNNIQ